MTHNNSDQKNHDDNKTEKVCKICYESENLISPCDCKGTCVYICKSCWKKCKKECSLCGYSEKFVFPLADEDLNRPDAHIALPPPPSRTWSFSFNVTFNDAGATFSLHPLIVLPFVLAGIEIVGRLIAKKW